MAFRIKGVSPETIDKWLHQLEDGHSIIDNLITMKYKKCSVEDFKKIDPSVTTYNSYPVIRDLNDYFKKLKYLFKADYDEKAKSPPIVIKNTKPLRCHLHNISYKTESDLIKHQNCSFKSTTERKEDPYNVVEDVVKETEERKMKKRQELRKYMEGK